MAAARAAAPGPQPPCALHPGPLPPVSGCSPHRSSLLGAATTAALRNEHLRHTQEVSVNSENNPQALDHFLGRTLISQVSFSRAATCQPPQFGMAPS